jgi:hypothetical protein
MSYVVPSVLVYQLLANAGGVANVTPDLDALIIGPCFNVVSYVPDSAASLIATAAENDAGAAFAITDNTVNNVFNLPGQVAGQDVEESTLQVFLNNSRVETIKTQFTGDVGGNLLTFGTPVGVTCTASADNNVLAGVTNASLFTVGDHIKVTNAGSNSTDFLSVITAIGSDTLTLSDNAVLSVSAAPITKVAVSNTNPITATLKVEAGDQVVLTYGGSGTFTSTVMEVNVVNGNVDSIRVADMLPSGLTSSFTVSVRKTYNNLPLSAVFGSYTNLDFSTTGANGKVTIYPLPKVGYGTVVSGEVHVDYRALRKDLAGIVQDINSEAERLGVLGVASDLNPLGLGVQLALANTTGRVRALAVETDDLGGYVAALEASENVRVYALTMLTQDPAILAALQVHVDGMSTPENASWRTALVNSAIPTSTVVGIYNANLVNANLGNNLVSLINGAYVLTASNASFISDGVVPGDTIHATTGSGNNIHVYDWKVLSVISNQQVQVNATGTASAVSYYVRRTLTRAQQSKAVVAMSKSFGDKRVSHVQPDLCGVSVGGVVKYLPGYYLCCALAGLISGLPVQQGLTNIGIAGISDLARSNFYFTRPQLNEMAAAGTLLLVQEDRGTIPFVRHELTTDMTVLEYREIQQVKNLDFLSYYFHDIFAGFIGKWNITPDSLNTLRQTFTAAGRQLQGKKLPKIGAPLVDFQIQKLEQDANNKDNVNAVIPVKIPTVMNYINIYLVV